MQLEIKTLTAADRAILDRVAEEVFDEPIRPERLAAYLADPRHHMIVAIEGGQVVGQVAAVMHRHPDKAPELFIDEIGVTAALRHRGIGRRLLDEMLALGKAWAAARPGSAPSTTMALPGGSTNPTACRPSRS